MRLRCLPACLLLSCTLSCVPPKPVVPDAGAPAPAMHVVFDALPATLLSAWESSDGVLYAVGGDATSAWVLRHDGDGWWRMDPGTNRALWWVHGLSATDVYAVGEQGVITHFDGTRWRVEREGGDFTLYGVWGTHPGNLRAVGGNVQSSRARGVVLTRASGWAEQVTGLPPATPLFKIWGRSSADYFVVGERGLVARGGAGGLAPLSSGTPQRLTTVHGNASEVYAVGGITAPVLERLVDSSWRALNVPGEPSALNGVAVAADGTTLVVGFDGYLARGQGDDFALLQPVTSRGLHGVVAGRDGFVAVGGELLGPFGNGVVLASGALSGGALRDWPHAGERWDAGLEDAGVEDGGTDAGREEPDGGWLTEGAACDGRYEDCRPGLDCWLVFGPFKSYCAALCTDVSECGAYGVNACCKVPGPQVMTPVCLPEIACDGGN